MTNENLTQDAPQAQDPSPAPEAKQDAQTEQVKEQTPLEKAKEEMVPLKRLNRLRAALGNEQRQLQEEKRLREAAEKRIAEYEAKINPLADKPNLDNFDTPEDYAEALADWKLNQKEKEKTKAEPKGESVEEQVKKQVEFTKVAENFKAKEAEFRAKEPNYDKAANVVNQFIKVLPQNDPGVNAFSNVLMKAPDPAALINHLGTNPQEMLDMVGKTPGEIEDILLDIIDNKLGAPKQVSEIDDDEEEEQPPEALPKPPAALKANVRPKKTLNTMSPKELVKWAEG